MLKDIILKEKKVRIKGSDGKYVKDASGKYLYKTVKVPHSTARSSRKPKDAKSPKWVETIVPKKPKKVAGKKANPHRMTSVEYMHLELKKKRRDLSSEFADFYKKYPQAKPKKTAKPKKSGTVKIDCMNPSKHSACESAIYTYKNGNRRIVTWERVPKEKKVKGVADCGLSGGCKKKSSTKRKTTSTKKKTTLIKRKTTSRRK